MVNLILGSYSSQRPDLTPAAQSEKYERAYKPLLKSLYAHDGIEFTMYIAGPIIEWLERRHSEYVDVVSEMVKRRQLEMLGGAFYEPLMPLIPRTDQIGQLERMTTFVRKTFGRRPRGAWIPEGVWDQRIVSTLSSGGMEYIFLPRKRFPFTADGRHLRPLITEDQGKTLIVAPVLSRVADRMFIDPPEKIISRLRAFDTGSVVEPATMALIFDADQWERFAIADEQAGTATPSAASADEWFESFLARLEAERDWLAIRTPMQVMREAGAADRRYASVTSYSQLMSWVPESLVQDGYGDLGSFRTVFERYPESSRLYARMQHTHVMVNQIRGDRYRKNAAREELWRGQAHFAYWSNQHGGVYRSSIRKSAYAALIEAEKGTRQKGIFIPAISRVDVDLDGEEELLFQGTDINAYLDQNGAYVFELDLLSRNWNYLDTMQRRPEPYHDAEARSAGYDSWPRGAFVDHLLQADATMAPFAAGRRPLLQELSSVPYGIEAIQKEQHAVQFTMTTGAQDGLAHLSVRKRFHFHRNRIDVTYTIHNGGLASLRGKFATEVNLSFSGMDAGALRLFSRVGRQRTELSPDPIEIDAVSELQFHDVRNAIQIALSPTERPTVWSFPVCAIGLSDGAPEPFYQSNCAVFLWPVDLPAGGSMEMSVSMKLDRMK